MKQHHVIAFLCALIVLAIMAGGFRMLNWVPLVLAGWTYVAVMLALMPRRRRVATETPPPVLPETVSREDFDEALSRLDSAAYDLRALADRATPRIRRLFKELSEKLGRIRTHLHANPVHVGHTRGFVRHTLGQMIEAAQGYADLSSRAGADQDDRLAEVFRQIEGFGPVLEKIDRACVENDLTALEIHMDVLSDQLRRRR